MADSEGNEAPDERHDDPHGNRGEGNHPPKEGQWVPLDRAEQMARNAAENVRQELTTRFESEIGKLKETNETKQQPVYTRGQLQQYVDDGKLTEDARDQILFEQAERQIREKVSKDVRSELETSQKASVIRQQIGQYTATLPALVQRDSDERKRVEREFFSLVRDYGMNKDDPATELLAIRNVYGPVEALRAKGERDYEHHQETGGGSGGGERPPASKDTPPKHLSQRERTYYAQQIEKGRYKDWKEVDDLLTKYANPKVRARHSAVA